MIFSIRDQFGKVCCTKSSKLALQFQYIPDAIQYVLFFRRVEAGAVANMLLLTLLEGSRELRLAEYLRIPETER